MKEKAIREDVLILAIELIDELATEIDLWYEDADLKEAGLALTYMETLQTLVGGAPTDTYLHIMDRYRKATGKSL
ncbi:hypothetical protein [Rhizobium sp. BK176]|uniref:hypothetical protein n=1 Tax=Rhizobium sp. BK176 TaxID=2587071 RepID=UPI00216A7ECB|nr:hypothetical protein [Rhizobium sp. BK176]MCS4089349.1 hypothetical protein [Rhizobium sp. BK176]